MPAEEFLPVAGPRRLPPGKIRKCDLAPEFEIPGIASKHRSGSFIHVGDDEWRGAEPGCSKRPFDVGRDGEPPPSPGMVGDLQARDLDRILDRDILCEFELNAIRGVLESAVALAVPSAIRRAGLANGKGRRAP